MDHLGFFNAENQKNAMDFAAVLLPRSNKVWAPFLWGIAWIFRGKVLEFLGHGHAGNVSGFWGFDKKLLWQTCFQLVVRV